MFHPNVISLSVRLSLGVFFVLGGVFPSITPGAHIMLEFVSTLIFGFFLVLMYDPEKARMAILAWNDTRSSREDLWFPDDHPRGRLLNGGAALFLQIAAFFPGRPVLAMSVTFLLVWSALFHDEFLGSAGLFSQKKGGDDA